jgi:DNA processing protein
VVSELPAGTEVRRWCFPARNRIIAALADVTVVVEAARRSGALITARLARDLGRDVAAVPGRVSSPQAQGTNALLYDGAGLVRDTQDVLDLLFGAGAITAARGPEDPGLDAELRALLDDIAGGRDTVGALTADPSRTDAVLAGLAELELLGHVRRGLGGRYVAVT